MKKPFLHATAAALYIVTIVCVINIISIVLRDRPDNIVMPMAMLSLFVLSAAVMGFFFLSEPVTLLLENRKKEAVAFFAKTVAIFAGYVALFTLLMFIIVYR